MPNKKPSERIIENLESAIIEKTVTDEVTDIMFTIGEIISILDEQAEKIDQQDKEIAELKKPVNINCGKRGCNDISPHAHAYYTAS